ncbi:hypothetical protein ACPOL_0529 [Acidisarcina polymorpha]|uniref:Uncharacterized protein n=1 Tax=Acidisarcina polymorpha TaxID=2211140 RepID=A0A2Z5FTT1_9BACT|nr:hypothetical protein ACPOL_0529 [Acidisarcina polymorpha]
MTQNSGNVFLVIWTNTHERPTRFPYLVVQRIPWLVQA